MENLAEKFARARYSALFSSMIKKLGSSKIVNSIRELRTAYL